MYIRQKTVEQLFAAYIHGQFDFLVEEGSDILKTTPEEIDEFLSALDTLSIHPRLIVTDDNTIQSDIAYLFVELLMNRGELKFKDLAPELQKRIMKLSFQLVFDVGNNKLLELTI